MTRARSHAVRAEVIGHYGGACSCCGETNPDFLTIDHPDYDGAAERRRVGIHSGYAFYRWLKGHEFPEHVRLLCYNCNLGARHHGGICPHLIAA